MQTYYYKIDPGKRSEIASQRSFPTSAYVAYPGLPALTISFVAFWNVLEYDTLEMYHIENLQQRCAHNAFNRKLRMFCLFQQQLGVPI